MTMIHSIAPGALPSRTVDDHVCSLRHKQLDYRVARRCGRTAKMASLRREMLAIGRTLAAGIHERRWTRAAVFGSLRRYPVRALTVPTLTVHIHDLSRPDGGARVPVHHFCAA